MGLLTGLLTLPLAPVRGVVWIAEQVAEEADRQLYDEGIIRRELLQLELEFDEGKIDEQERDEREQALLERLAVSQARRDAAREMGPDGMDGLESLERQEGLEGLYAMSSREEGSDG